MLSHRDVLKVLDPLIPENLLHMPCMSSCYVYVVARRLLPRICRHASSAQIDGCRRAHPVVHAHVLPEIEVQASSIIGGFYDGPCACDATPFCKDDQCGEGIDALHGPHVHPRPLQHLPSALCNTLFNQAGKVHGVVSSSHCEREASTQLMLSSTALPMLSRGGEKAC